MRLRIRHSRQSWNHQAVCINLRTRQAFGIDGPSGQSMIGKVAPGTWYHLQFRWENNQLAAEASHDGKLWFTLATYLRNQFEGYPVAVRLCKMNGAGKPQDYQEFGPVGATAIKAFIVYGLPEGAVT